MNILSVLSILSFMLCLYLGLHVLFIDKKSGINRLFFFLCLSLAIWTFCSIFITSAKNKENLLFWFKISTFGFVPFVALSLHFNLVLTKKVIKIKNIFYSFIYLPTIILMYGNFTSFIVYKDFIKVNDYWIFVLAKGSPWLLFYYIYIFSYPFLSTLLLFLLYIKSESSKYKRQSIIMLISYIITALSALLDGIVLPAFTSYQSIGFAPVGMLVLMIGIWYAIVKYRFLSITPELVSKDLIENIDESVILLDNSLNIMKINPKTEVLIDYKSTDVKLLSISKIISESKAIIFEINNMIDTNHKTFSTRIHYIKKDGKNILMDIKFYIIKDKYKDLIGIMLIGKEVKELKQFREIFKITHRQEEIIRMIVNGKFNKEIAKSIGVAESTIKGHIRNIYNKLGVTNKVQLLNFLKNFNLIPAEPAEKRVLLLRRE